MLDVNLLPKKFYEFNYFKKKEKGCVLYSYSQKLNINTTIVCNLPDFEIENDFCVDAKAMEMYRVLSPAEVSVDKKFVIKSKKGTYSSKLITCEYVEPNNEYEYSISVDVSKLNIAKDFTAKENKRPVLTGVNCTNTGSICATDSFVAYRYRGSLEKITSSITLPTDFIDLISKDFTDNVEISFNKYNCMVSNDNISYISRLLDGSFPDLSRIYNSKSEDKQIVFDNTVFKSVISLAKEVGEENGVAARLHFSKGKLEAYGSNDYVVELESSNYKEYDFNVALDTFSKVTSKVNGKEITINYSDCIRPLFIDDGENEYLVLPIRISYKE